MKKISILLACAAVLGLASCETDKEPKLTIPQDKTFTLNEPVFANQYLELQDGNTFELVASQPDYGYAATAVYAAQVSLSNDFAAFEELTPVDPGLARMTFKDKDLAVALCKLNGIDASFEGQLPDAQKVYFRATCRLPGVEESLCTSNVVAMDQVKFYFATQGQREIYLVGSVEGWAGPDESQAAHYATWALKETGIGTNVYAGSFEFPAGEVTFRFYTALTGWNGGASIGYQEEDKATKVTLIDNVYEGSCVHGKGSWSFDVAEAGNVNLTVDLKNMTVKFEVGGEKNWDIYPCMYIVGNVEGWLGPDPGNADHYADWRIFDINGDGIYVSKPGEPFSYTEAPMFRFYSALTGWEGDDSWGAQEADSPVDETLTDNVFTGKVVKGKGAFNFPTAPVPGTFEVEYNSNTGDIKITFAPAE